MQTFSISSVFKSEDSTSNSDFLFTLRESISVDTSKLTKAFLTQFICPFSWYTVNASNNTLIFNEGASDRTATFTPGTYDHTSLATEVGIALNLGAAINSYTCTYDSTSDLYTVASSANMVFKFSHGDTTCETLLGFPSVDNGSGISSYTGTLSPKLLPSQIFLKIDFRENSKNLLQTKNNWHTFSFPIVSDFGELLVYKPDTPMLIQKLSPQSVIKEVKIDLYDEDSKTKIDLRGRDIEIEIRLEK